MWVTLSRKDESEMAESKYESFNFNEITQRVKRKKLIKS